MDLNILVPLKHSLKTTVKFNQISDIIVEKLKMIGDIDGQSKLSIELINFITNLIEYLVKTKYKINKENLLIFSLKRVVSLSEEEEEIIKNTIKYLHDNKLIVKVGKLKYLLEYSKNIIKKQLWQLSNNFLKNSLNNMIVEQIPITGLILHNTLTQYTTASILTKIGIKKLIISLIISFLWIYILSCIIMNDNILRYLPENRELPFYEGCYYSLSELLKTVHDTHTRDLIKIKLCDLRNVIIKLNPNYRK